MVFCMMADVRECPGESDMCSRASAGTMFTTEGEST